jgi:hypothetical protein
MSKHQEKRQVQITNAATGETRLSEPIPVQGSRAEVEIEPVASKHTESAFIDVAQHSVVASFDEKQVSVPKKPKPEIETLEQFITYVYSRKGQRVALAPKVERQIAENPRLQDEAMSRLLAIAAADEWLAVPRELLLISREVVGFPALKEAFTSFVMNVMLKHPAFASESLQAAVRHLPEAPSPLDALTSLSQWQPRPDKSEEGKDVTFKPAEINKGRRNVINLLVTWFYCHRSMNLEELAGLLMQVCWLESGRTLETDLDKLWALTSLDDSAVLGWLGQRWRQQMMDARLAQTHAIRELESARAHVEALDAEIIQLRSDLVEHDAQLTGLRAQSTQKITELTTSHTDEKMHLSHEIEALRGRLVRQLNESAEMLEVGLSALRNNTPNINVMVQRAEQVVDALRSELKSLGSDGNA